MSKFFDHIEESPNGRRAPPRGSLPPHVAEIRVSGKRLGDLSQADIARLCLVLDIPDTGHECGKANNAEKLVQTLDAIGRAAAERAIEEHLQQKLGGVS